MCVLLLRVLQFMRGRLMAAICVGGPFRFLSGDRPPIRFRQFRFILHFWRSPRDLQVTWRHDSPPPSLVSWYASRRIPTYLWGREEEAAQRHHQFLRSITIAARCFDDDGKRLTVSFAWIVAENITGTPLLGRMPVTVLSSKIVF